MSYLLKPYFLNSYTIQIFYTEEANTSIMPTSHEKSEKKDNRSILTCAICIHGQTYRNKNDLTTFWIKVYKTLNIFKILKTSFFGIL